MQKFEFLRQPLLGELAMSRKKKEEERENNAIYSGHLRLCQQPRAAHSLRSDQFRTLMAKTNNVLLIMINLQKIIYLSMQLDIM